MGQISLTLAVMLATCCQPTIGNCQLRQDPVAYTSPENTTRWLVGKGLDKGLQQPISLEWSSAPLRQSLMHLSEQRRVAIFVDRRVDPSKEVELKLPSLPVEEILYRIADATDCSVCRLGNVFYFGPRNDAAELVAYRQSLFDQLRQLPARERRAILASKPMRWTRLTQPKDLLEELVGEGVVATNEIELPHDLWPEYSLPPISLLDRLLLTTFGFGVTARIATGDEPGRLELGKFVAPATTRFESQIRLSDADLETLTARFPGVEFRRVARSVSAENVSPATAYQIHRAMAELRLRDRPPGPNTGHKIVAMNQSASIGDVLTTVAIKLGVELTYPPELKPLLRQQIDINVSGVTYEQLIATALEGTDLAYELSDDQLLIRRK